MRHAHHGGQVYLRVFHEKLFDLPWVDGDAVADDQIPGAVDDVVVAIVIAAADVTRTKPAVAHDLRGLVGPVVVALHDVVAADRDLTGPRTLDFVPVRVDELQLHTPDGNADRAGLDGPVGSAE